MLQVNQDIKRRTTAFFKFMIEQNPNFTDLEKLEQQYKLQIKTNFDIINQNRIMIKDKQNRIKEIDRISGDVSKKTLLILYVLYIINIS